MQPPLSAQQRRFTLNAFQVQEFDLAIVGGGINGAGVARDAASRGLKVALIEARDFAWGTSSRSSKLVHGGIRYLENLEFGLVFEALSERQKLFSIAPNLVHPLRFVIPIYKTGRVPAWKMGLGMWAYDALSLFEAPELHKYLAHDEASEQYPLLQTKDLSGVFTYADAYMDDDRLVHETLRSARALGAEIANYVQSVGAHIQNGRVHALECQDVVGGQTFLLKAKHFISTVGPWTDIFGGKIFPDWKRKLRPSKGVHLTFRRERFPLQDAVVMGAEKRIVFAIPRHEMVIVGTTDTDFPLDPGNVRVEPADVDYLLRVVEQYFPGAAISRKDIIGAYAGVRPLVDDGAETESKTSREHAIWTDPRGVTFVAGGKYTTYRNMARQTVDEVLRWFPLEDQVTYGQSRTLSPLNPLADEALLERARREHADWARAFDLPAEITGLLADRHGLEARRVLDRMARHRIGNDPWTWMWCAEAEHAVEHTMCLYLTDFYFRRTPLVLSRADHGLPYAGPIAQAMGARLGWRSERISDEINALQNQIRRELSAAIQVDPV